MAAITLPTQWVPDCAAFHDHWRSLCGGDLMPSSEAWIKHVPTELVSRSLRLDILRDKALVRFVGGDLIERWGYDFTGQDLFLRRSKQYRKEILLNLTAVVHHPCGYAFETEYTNLKGRVLRVQGIMLPLSVKPGRPPRVVGLSADLPAEQRTSKAGHSSTTSASWVDLGAGHPTQPPYKPAQ